jgi:hypothetical protein
MKADDYNQKQISDGNITGSIITPLTELWQRKHGLPVDGKLDPGTLESLAHDEIIESDTDPRIKGLEVEKLNRGQEIMLGALSFVIGEIGQGETAGNNRGERIDYYRTTDGTGSGPGGAGAWCASFQSSGLVHSAKDIGRPLPCRTSRGAKNLGDSVGNAGQFLSVPERGCFVVWHRGVGRQGHIGQCESYDPITDTLVTIEGNKLEPRPRKSRWAKVARHTYPNGLWREKIYSISTLSKDDSAYLNGTPA